MCFLTMMSSGFATTLITTLAALLPAPAPAPSPAPVATITAPALADVVTMRIAPHAYLPGYYNVTVSGECSSAPHSGFAVSVYGEDAVFDDWLFDCYILLYQSTDYRGRFSVTEAVHRTRLNEDWEGQDEIYAVVRVGGRRLRTTTWRQSF
jgi:hypothetical protein